MGCCCSKEQESDDDGERTPLLGDSKTAGDHNVQHAPHTKRQAPITSVDPATGTNDAGDTHVEPEIILPPKDTTPTKVDFKPIQVPRYDQQMEANVARFNDYLLEYKRLQGTSDVLAQMYPEHNTQGTIVGCFNHVKITVGDKLAEALTVTDPACPWITYKVDKIHHSLLPALNTFNKASRLVKEITHEGPQLTVAVDDVTFAEPDMRAEITKCTKQLSESTRNLYMDNCMYDIKQFFRVKDMIEQIKNETGRICADLQSAAKLLTVSPITMTDDIAVETNKQDPIQDVLHQASPLTSAEEQAASPVSPDESTAKVTEESMQQTAVPVAETITGITLEDVNPVEGNSHIAPTANEGASTDEGNQQSGVMSEIQGDTVTEGEPIQVSSEQQSTSDCTEEVQQAGADAKPSDLQISVTASKIERQDEPSTPSAEETVPSHDADEASSNRSLQSGKSEEEKHTSLEQEQILDVQSTQEQTLDVQSTQEHIPDVQSTQEQISDILNNQEESPDLLSTERSHVQQSADSTPVEEDDAKGNTDIKQGDNSVVEPETTDDQLQTPTTDGDIQETASTEQTTLPTTNGDPDQLEIIDDGLKTAHHVLIGTEIQDDAGTGENTAMSGSAVSAYQSSGDADHDTESPADASKPAKDDEQAEADEKKTKKRRKKHSKRQKSVE